MRAEMLLSIISGILFAVPAYFIINIFDKKDALWVAALSFLLFSLLLFIFLLVEKTISEKKYAEAEKTITSSVFYKTNGNFDLGNKVINGNIYFCEDDIVFISIEKDPFIIEQLLINDLLKYEFERAKITITLKNSHTYIITTSDALNMLIAIW